MLLLFMVAKINLVTHTWVKLNLSGGVAKIAIWGGGGGVFNPPNANLFMVAKHKST